jgi:hypothetical protein
MGKAFSAKDGYAQIDLVQFSRDHLFAAETLFNLDVRTLDSAGYLAQLGIELLLKALLLQGLMVSHKSRLDTATAIC